MSCCFCISISGPGPNPYLTLVRYGLEEGFLLPVCAAYWCCCCLCRNYLNEITRTYTAEMPDEALSWAELGLDLTWCRCSCCSFVCFAVKSWRSNFFSLFATNNIVNCFRFSALMGITKGCLWEDRHSMPAAHLHSIQKQLTVRFMQHGQKVSTRTRKATPLSLPIKCSTYGYLPQVPVCACGI